MFKTLAMNTVKVLNVAIIASMVGIGAYSIRDVQAQQTLSLITEEQKVCLQQNIFFESRNQSVLGQVAVAWVTINRMESSIYPDSICDVVKQANRDSDGNLIRNECQFSWYCDGKSDSIPDNAIAQRAWEDAGIIAEVVLLDWAFGKKSPVQDSIMYHADYVNPYWTGSYDEVVQIDDHIFYQKL